MTSKNVTRVSAFALLTAIALGACSGNGATSAPSTAVGGSEAPSGPAASQPTGVTGTINVSGSSTVEPISTSIAEALKVSNPDFNYTVTGPGTGDGFKTFCKGETDISDASRKIKDEEAAACAAAGIEYTELAIAFDGITVMTSPENATIECLSFADLYALVGPESTGFKKWTDASALAKELGSNTAFPDGDLALTGPGEESGTYDSFIEITLKGIATARKQDATITRPDYIASANDNTIIENVAGSPTSLGWVGFAFAEENADKVKELGVSKDPNGTCVKPTRETIADGSYPVARTLYIYVNKAKAAANPAVKAYVDYYLADGTITTTLQTVPYVELPAARFAESQAAWAAAQ